jgi:plasmid maintenance system antidote protein VapI
MEVVFYKRSVIRTFTGKEEDLMVVQSRLAEYIRENGIKQIWISKRTGIHESRLSAILTRRYKMTADEYEKIVRAIGKEPNDFMETA